MTYPVEVFAPFAQTKPFQCIGSALAWCQNQKYRGAIFRVFVEGKNVVTVKYKKPFHLVIIHGLYYMNVV